VTGQSETIEETLPALPMREMADFVGKATGN
jgi:hypothetical protein